MNDLARRVASTVADVRGRRTLTVLDLGRLSDAERTAAMAAVLDGRSGDSLLARWDRSWLTGLVSGTALAAGAVSLGVAVTVATEGTAGGFLLVGAFPAVVMGVRKLSDHLDSPSRIAWPAGLAAARTLTVAITPEDRLAHDLWARGHQLWRRVSEQADDLPQAELSMVRDLAYQAQAEVARLVDAERRHLSREADERTRAACSALARLERAAALALGLAERARRGMVIPGPAAEPGGVLSEADEPSPDRAWSLYR